MVKNLNCKKTWHPSRYETQQSIAEHKRRRGYTDDIARGLPVPAVLGLKLPMLALSRQERLAMWADFFRNNAQQTKRIEMGREVACEDLIEELKSGLELCQTSYYR
ncbi:hypothetical protein PAPHI01_0835 [Pancytospora philotis]|nr:hypothetical protein PAPHI01_0835 [Pancytospora philotis]